MTEATRNDRPKAASPVIFDTVCDFGITDNYGRAMGFRVVVIDRTDRDRGAFLASSRDRDYTVTVGVTRNGSYYQTTRQYDVDTVKEALALGMEKMRASRLRALKAS